MDVSDRSSSSEVYLFIKICPCIFRSPVTVGTIWAMNKAFFNDIGALDDQMQGWGGENLDITIRVYTVYPKKYAYGFVVFCFVVVTQSFIMNTHEVFIHIHQGCFAGTGAIVRLPQCQWSKPDGYGKISQCITTTKHSKAKTVCIFLGIYCNQIPVFGKRFW